MNIQLEKTREEWINLVRQTKTKEADSLYWNKIFPIIEKEFIEKNKLKEEYDWLVLPSGLESSYYILLIKAIRPKKVYFLGTNEFKDFFLDKIIEKAGLKASDYIIETVEYTGMDVSEVYEKIRNHLDLFKNKKVVLDLTRGKRILSVGAGIVGAFFGFDLVYVDEDWIDDIKRGLPGSEKLVTVKNPFEVFCDLDIKEARELFNSYNYGASIFLYKNIKDKVSDPRRIEIEESLSEAYLFWNSFNFKAAISKFQFIINKSKQYNMEINPELKNNFKALKILDSINLEKLEDLTEEKGIHIIIDLYSNALRKAEISMFEDAISRLYRVIELISQYRLSHHNIKTSNPLLEKYKKKYEETSKKIHGSKKEIPSEIGLKDGYILLFILKDYLIKDYSFMDLKKMFGIIGARDSSIVAHGLSLVGPKIFNNMNKLVKNFIETICDHQNENFTELIKQHTFTKL
jgi:CRISPR-associated protein (TIGR02710 family)